MLDPAIAAAGLTTKEMLKAPYKHLSQFVKASMNKEFLADKTARTDLINKVHNREGHRGTQSAVSNIIDRHNKWWPDIRADVDAVVNRCIPCQKWRTGSFGFHPQITINARLPLDQVHMILVACHTTVTPTFHTSLSQWTLRLASSG